MVSVRAGKLRAGPRRGAHAPHPIPHGQQERTGGLVWEVGTPRSWERSHPFPAGPFCLDAAGVLERCPFWAWGSTEDGGLPAGHRADPLKMESSAADVARTSHTKAPSVLLESPGGGCPAPGSAPGRVGGEAGLSEAPGPVSSPPRPPQPGEPRPHPPRKGTPRGPRVPGARQTRGQSHAQGERLAL